jgi:hypothetical protein
MRIAGSEYFKTMALVAKVEAQTSQSGFGGTPTTDPLLDSGSADPLLNAGSGNPPGIGNLNSGQAATHPRDTHPSPGKPNSNGQSPNNSVRSAIDSPPSQRRGNRLHENSVVAVLATRRLPTGDR